MIISVSTAYLVAGRLFPFVHKIKSVKNIPKSKKGNEIWTFINVHFKKPKKSLGNTCFFSGL